MSDSTQHRPAAGSNRHHDLAHRLAGTDPTATAAAGLESDAGLTDASFSRQSLAVLCIVVEATDPRERDRAIDAAVWMAARHHGTVDHFHRDGMLISFDTPARCLPMAMNLQRSCPRGYLRMGVHAGIWEVASLVDSERGERCQTLLGAETAEAVRIAQSAAIGSIVISSQAYALIQHDIGLYSQSCILTEEFEDSGFAIASLTPAPLRGGGNLSTFAGLGLN